MPLITDSSEVQNFLDFGTYRAPNDVAYPLSVSISMDNSTSKIVKFPSGSIFSPGGVEFSNGQTVNPMISARSVEEAIQPSLKSLLDRPLVVASGILLDGYVTLRVSQSIPDGQSSRRTCSRTEHVYVARFVSASDPLHGKISFGLTHESVSPSIRLLTTSSTRPGSFRSMSSLFSIESNEVKYNPSNAPSTPHLEEDSGLIEIIAGNTGTPIGSVTVSGTRYKTRTVQIDRSGLEATIRNVFPFLESGSLATEIITQLKAKFTDSIPVNWTEEAGDEHILLQFQQEETADYVSVALNKPSEVIAGLHDAVSRRLSAAVETTRSRISENIVTLLQSNSSSNRTATVNVDAIQFDVAAVNSSDRRLVINAIANSAAHAIAKSLGYIGLTIDNISVLSDSDIMSDPRLTNFRLGYSERPFGGESMPFAKLLTGLGRTEPSRHDGSGTYLPNGARSLSIDYSVQRMIKNAVGYHDIDTESLGVAPTIRTEVNGAEIGSGSVDFGVVAVGATSPVADIAISNTGTTTLVLKKFELPFGFRIKNQIASMPIDISPGKSYTLQVEMRTSTEGVKSGSLLIISNDRTRNPVSISLTGRVTDLKTNFLTVLTHGWDPQIPFTKPVRESWEGDYRTLVENYRKAELSNVNHVVIPNLWDSSTGWNQAIRAVAYWILAEQDNPFALPALLAYVRPQMDIARKLAAESAWNIKKIVDAEIADLGEVKVHLIGHSRGGAVSSLASRLLSSTKKVDQLTVLDGYSYDWPGLWGILGDYDIESLALADRKVNYRVEMPLIPLTDPRAPVRRTFQSNELIRGYQPYGDASNHTNISDLYFHSSAVQAEGGGSPKDYLSDSPIGRWIENKDGNGEGDDEPDTLPDSELASVTGFTDGDFSDSWGSQQFVDAILDLDASSNPELTNYQEFLRNEGDREFVGWQTTGKVTLVSSGLDAAAQLIATASTPAAVSQPVFIPKGTNSIRLRIKDLAPGEVGKIRIWVDDQVLSEQAIHSATQNVDVELVSPQGRMVQIKVEITSSGENEKRVEIDDIRMELPLAIDAIDPSPNFLSAESEVRFKAISNLPFSEAGGKIRFFVESNDQPGLQPNDDLFLGEVQAMPGQTEWEVSASKSAFPFKGTYSILAYAETGTARGPVRELSFWVENSDSPLTNKVNPLDVNRDASVSPLDVLVLINFINFTGPGKLRPSMLPITHAIDVNDDGFISPLDVLMVINHINSRKDGGEGEASNTEIPLNLDDHGEVSYYFDANDGFESIGPNRQRFALGSSLSRKRRK
jgi:hypothetical protein